MSTNDGLPYGDQAFPPRPTYGVPPQAPVPPQPPIPPQTQYPPQQFPPQNQFPPPGQFPPQGQFPPPGQVPVQSPPPGGAPAPAAPSGGKKKSGIAGLIVLVLIVGGIFAASRFTNRNDINKAGVGDCAKFEEGADKPYVKADCSDAAATYVIVGVVSADKECKDVAGAERSINKEGGGDICFGVKGVDPATSINVAKEGDCLTVVGDDAVRTACTSAEATHEVLKRLTDVSKFALKDPCEAVPDYTGSYSWSWTTEGTVSVATTYDVVLCLGDL